jgi:hypothetical protein
MTREYRPFIDWMKCLGIFVIVMGHTAARPTNYLIPPIYPKQLGVAFFIFVMGYSLAREVRPRARVVLNRLFEILFFGAAIAGIISVLSYIGYGRLTLTNYLPLLGGLNVVFNNFPANPTTWYIGTYTHILLLWAVLASRVRVRPWMLAVSLVSEVAVRALLAERAGGFVAYMLFSNWTTVFLFGLFMGQRRSPEPRRSLVTLAVGTAALVAFGAAWYALLTPAVARGSFPWMTLSVGSEAASAIARSASVSLVYLAFTFLVYTIAAHLPGVAVARFFARNTAIVFIAHMPVFFAIEGPLARLIPPYGPRALLQMSICFVGIAIVSEIVRRALPLRAMREWCAARLLSEPSAQTARMSRASAEART